LRCVYLRVLMAATSSRRSSRLRAVPRCRWRLWAATRGGSGRR
jgi:hypothetical protein